MELWPLVMEKAFAKMVGGYAGLSGGHPLWALEALTGDYVCKFLKENDNWEKFDI